MSAPSVIPQKTAGARERLQGPRQSLPARLRTLLITIDGRKSLAELSLIAQGLGLESAVFEQLREQGLIAWHAEGAPAAPPADAEQARQHQQQQLVRAKLFAMDLAARMLAGRDHELRERARGLDSESKFHLWLGECATAIAAAGSEERAALFLERVAAAG